MKRWQYTLSACALLTMAVAVPAWAGDKPPLTSPITGETREFTFNLNVVPDYEIRPEVPAAAGGVLPKALVQLWAFACRSSMNSLLPPGSCGSEVDPTLPGPFLHVNKGDLVRLTFDNTHEKPHTIHLHGFHRNNVDGVHPVPPHKDFLIEFVANPCGTYVYHCHINTPLHQDRGMYGQFIVDCPASDPEEDVDHEFLMVVDEHPRDWPALGDDPKPETHEFIINGKAFVGPAVLDVPYPPGNPNNIRTIKGDGTVVAGPMVVHKDDKVRIRLSSFGMANHEMELVGPLPSPLPSPTFPLPSLTVQDTAVRQGSNPVLARPASIPEPPLEVVTNHSLNVTFTAGPPGTYLFRSTKLEERTNFGGFPEDGGMQTILVVLDEDH